MLSTSANAQSVAQDMTRAAAALLTQLDADQRQRIEFAFTDREREDWHYVPRSRAGIPWQDLNEPQRAEAATLLRSALSPRGFETAEKIRQLETVLAEIERNPVRRDPQKYYLSIFGQPGSDPWGWRFEGHHIAINVTIAGDNVVVATPHFFGANPGEVRTPGPHHGRRVLAAEEDLGRALMQNLTTEQRRVALIAEDAPGEIYNVPGRNSTEPQGIAYAALDESQRAALLELVRHYVERFRPKIAADAMRRLETGGYAGIHFAWAGGIERGDRHYYRLQAGGFVIEYDNTQNGANHIHTVWREFGREFGHDALREHYATAHQDTAKE